MTKKHIVYDKNNKPVPANRCQVIRNADGKVIREIVYPEGTLMPKPKRRGEDTIKPRPKATDKLVKKHKHEFVDLIDQNNIDKVCPKDIDENKMEDIVFWDHAIDNGLSVGVGDLLINLPKKPTRQPHMKERLSVYFDQQEEIKCKSTTSDSIKRHPIRRLFSFIQKLWKGCLMVKSPGFRLLKKIKS